MHVYFIARSQRNSDEQAFYAELVKYIACLGTVSGRTTTDGLAAGYDLPPAEVHEQTLRELMSCDAVVAEVTYSSTAAGYEIGRAVENGKPVLALFRSSLRPASALIVGSDKVTARSYETPAEAKKHIDEFLAGGKKKSVQTLVVVHQGDRILLGQKKRGFGAGHWNGFGGKVHGNETIAQSARRELEEEAGLGTTELHKRGILCFWFHSDPVMHEVHLFSVQTFTGTPVETDEMRPQWFSIKEIPYDHMWPDDKYWLSIVLAGKNVQASFWFNKEGQVDKKEVKEY